MGAARTDKGKRLASTILMLKESNSLTADEIASRLAVTVRTVYRDLDALASAGVPIRGTPGPTGGYQLAEHFPVDPFVYVQADPPPVLARGPSGAVNPSDATARILSSALPPSLREAFNRLRERFLFDSSAWFWEDTQLRHFADIKQAVLHDEVVELVYTPRGSTEIQDDVVEPYGLVWRQGHWYLVAWFRLAKRFERHRLVRIVGVRPTGERFKRRADFDLQARWAQLLDNFGRGTTLVRIRIDYPATKDFESFAWKEDQKIAKHQDHWVVEMKVDADDWLIPLVLSYGDKIRVLEPESLKDRVAQALESALAAYRSPGAEKRSDPDPRMTSRSRNSAAKMRRRGDD